LTIRPSGHIHQVRNVRGGIPLKIRVLDGSTVTEIRVGGVADLATAPALRAVLFDLVDAGRDVRVDLAALRLIDAHCVGVLIAADRRSEAGLRVRGAVGRVLRVLEICDADRLVDPRPDTAAASGPYDDRTVETLLRAGSRRPDDHELHDLVRHMAITDGYGLAVGLARRYYGRGESEDDLNQIALLGLIKAVDGFDPNRSTPFAGYAVPTILGELKRHFRDHGWQIRVPRKFQEIRLELAPARERLSQRLGRAPTSAELATELNSSEEDVIASMKASEVYRVRSLSRPVAPRGREDHEGTELADLIGDIDPQLDLIDYRESLRPLLAALPPRHRQILALRFCYDQTQAQIATAVGVSQMHVSRLLNDILTRLRRGLLTT
jgi:RNA polymerase sigma-B factor